jgi:hypothetical protein
MDPGWLSRQLALRRYPEIFTELEQGRLSFGQATELQRAPAYARAQLVARVLGGGGVVTTAVIRDWVRQARSAATASRVVRREGETEPPAYVMLVERLRSLGPPLTPESKSELRELIALATELLGGAESRAVEEQPSVKIVAREVRCLMCGEHVGDVTPTGFSPQGPNSARSRGGRLLCGRCGGSVIAGEQRGRYRYGASDSVV